MSRPDLNAALSATGTGVHLALEVTPGARGAAFPSGFNTWRQRIGIRVTAPPQDGKANEEVCRAVAVFFGLAPSEVVITHGATTTQKTVRLDGADLDDVRARLEAADW